MPSTDARTVSASSCCCHCERTELSAQPVNSADCSAESLSARPVEHQLQCIRQASTLSAATDSDQPITVVAAGLRRLELRKSPFQPITDSSIRYDTLTCAVGADMSQLNLPTSVRFAHVVISCACVVYDVSLRHRFSCSKVRCSFQASLSCLSATTPFTPVHGDLFNDTRSSH